MYYIDTLKRELIDTNVDGHGCHTAIHFGVKAKENKDKVRTLYWILKLHKNPIKQDLLLILVLVRQQNFLNCKTHVLRLLRHAIKYCEKLYERSSKNLFWSIKKSGEILDKLKTKYFNATSLSTYDLSTLYTTLPHNLIKDKLIDLTEITFNREGALITSHVTTKTAFLLR